MLTVNTLGKFQIIEADVVLDDDKIRSTRLSNLLVYLILHRTKTLTVDEIASALWQDEETNNPAGALKNLMYCLRNLMKQYFGEQEFIQTNRGSYRWNPKTEVSVDVEAFEQDYNEAKRHDITDEEAKNCLERAILRYKGRFYAEDPGDALGSYDEYLLPLHVSVLREASIRALHKVGRL